jgi:predicted HTH domain antitoxin
VCGLGGWNTPTTIEIPDEVMDALKLPPRRASHDLRVELAVHLVAERLLPVAAARRLADLPRLVFEQILNGRGIPTSPQAPEELDRDLAAFAEP